MPAPTCEPRWLTGTAPDQPGTGQRLGELDRGQPRLHGERTKREVPDPFGFATAYARHTNPQLLHRST